MQPIQLAARIVLLLEELKDVLDNYSDVNDGADGQPVPNRAMSAIQDIDAVLAEIGRMQ
jgi:hypothetical protein